MTEPISLVGAYAELEKSPAGRGRVQRRVTLSPDVDLVVFVGAQSRCRGARFEFLRQSTPTGTVEKVRGVTIVTTEAEGLYSIEIEQTNPVDGALFVTVIESLAQTIGQNAGRDARAMLDKLTRWRSFFARRSQGMSREEQLGLFGELHALRLLAEGADSFGAAVYCWEGPHSEVHDFSQQDWALEVKSTSSLSSGSVTINSERQLDSSGVGALYLLFFAFDVRPHGAGRTLPAIVARIRHDLAHEPAVLDHFEDLLLSAGYVDVDAHLYGVHYTPVRQEAYSVDGAFPAIRPSELPAAVRRVRYALNVDLCQGWRRDLRNLLNDLGGRIDAGR